MLGKLLADTLGATTTTVYAHLVGRGREFTFDLPVPKEKISSTNMILKPEARMVGVSMLLRCAMQNEENLDNHIGYACKRAHVLARPTTSCAFS